MDDDQNALKTMSIVLKQLDVDIYLAGSANQARTIIEETMPDLMLLDVMMPVMGGFSFCSELRKDEKPVKFRSSFDRAQQSF